MNNPDAPQPSPTPEVIMDRLDMLALAERCEQATGPDRELDYAILEQCDPQRFDYCSKDYDELCARLKEKGLWDARQSGAYAHAFAGTPRYTSSLDDAMTLVPGERGWNLHRYQSGWARACVYFDDGRDPGQSCDGKTPALALCAAALRSRANLNDKSGEGDK